MPARLEVIAGPMFSGKSEEIFRRIHLEKIARRSYTVIKPWVDTRTEDYIASRAIGSDGRSHDTNRLGAIVIRTIEQVREVLRSPVDTVIADECQFFDAPFVVSVRDALVARANENFLVLCAGLDTDFSLRGFGAVPGLIAMADHTAWLTGICMKCRAHGACLTQRIAGSTDAVQVGDADSYEVRCRNCFYIFSQKTPR